MCECLMHVGACCVWVLVVCGCLLCVGACCVWVLVVCGCLMCGCLMLHVGVPCVQTHSTF